ncbi:MAG: hypothetical protein FJ265_19825, partial [Planctomycetes bacterium]|nr:hypothetical protein [Planctomycetota bacterium]
VRFSIGIEDERDLLADLEQAFDRIGKQPAKQPAKKPARKAVSRT